MFFSKKSYSVHIRDRQITLEAKSGTNLYKLLLDENLITPTLCNGKGQCNKCKIRIYSNSVPKATSREMLNLGRVAVDRNYRLACQQTVKGNIEIDISEISGSVQFYNENKINNEDEQEKQNEAFETESNIEYAVDEINEEISNIQNEELEESTEQLNKMNFDTETVEEQQEQDNSEDETVSINDFTPEHHDKTAEDNLRNEDGPTDGVLLIQYKTGIRYYCYSAAIDNIVSEGLQPYHETLRDLVEKDVISDFLYTVLKIRDLERVIILVNYSEKYDSEVFLNMFRYYRDNEISQLYEVITPLNQQGYTINHFLRLLNAEKEQCLIISLDMLDRVQYMTPVLLTDMSSSLLKNTNMTAILPRGTNAILSFDSSLKPVEIENKDKNIDGLTLAATMQFIYLMHKAGIINNRFQLKSRMELDKIKVPLDLTVRRFSKNGEEGYYIYRDRFTEISITQENLDELFQMRSYIRSVIEYTKSLGFIDNITFYTAQVHNELINYMFELDFIPKEFAGKVTYRPGDAGIYAIKLFKEKDIPTFIKNNFNKVRAIKLEDEDEFKMVSSINSLEK